MSFDELKKFRKYCAFYSLLSYILWRLGQRSKKNYKIYDV